MIHKNTKKKIMRMFRYIVVMTMILNISMPCFFNIINAVIFPTNVEWPGKSEIRFNTTDNSEVFPDSYKQYIKNLKIVHPNWIFKAVYTGLDWTNSLKNESYDVNNAISAVPTSYSSNWKRAENGIFIDSGSFYTASKVAVAYTMDPRNFLNESGIFQFEALDYNEETGTVATIEKIISGTTMSNYLMQYKKSNVMVNLEDNLTWAQVIINAAKNAGTKGISAVHLASRMKQETSLEILNNGSISGSVVGYEGLYNFFNIGATSSAGQSNSVINGLIYASSQGWRTPAASINAGARYLANDYIQYGQNTVYFEKFDVSNIYGNATKLYACQYQQNILAPSSESKISYNAYSNTGLLNSSFVFYIPVYENMPSTISAHPDSEITSSTITGTDIIYLDDKIINGTDYFNIRSGAGTEFNTIGQIVELSEGAENRTKFTRTQIGTNGWDKIKLNNGTEGYVYQAFTNDYNYIHVTGVTLNKSLVNFKLGETTTLTATISPTNAYIKNITWNSSNNSIATVDGNGKITPLAIGTVNITAKTLDGNKVVICAVTVDKTLASSISTNAEYPLVIGNYLQLAPTISPSTTTDNSYNISIADTSIATVENGRIKGLKVGNTIVTLTTKDGSNKSCTFTLKVAETVATIKNLTVDNNSIITKVALGTTASSIKSNITTGYTEKLVNSSNTALNDTDKVGTGTKVQISNGTTVLQEYTIVIYGDVSGDGSIDVVDLLMLKRKLTNKLILGEYANKAANISKNGSEPDVTDLLRLKRHLTNVNLIVQ